MKFLLLLVLLCPTLVGQRFDSECFTVESMRWTNHDLPELIKPSLPLAPGQPERDGVQVFITSKCGTQAKFVFVRIRYRAADGKARVYSHVVALHMSGDRELIGTELAEIGKGVIVTAVEVRLVNPSDIEEGSEKLAMERK